MFLKYWFIKKIMEHPFQKSKPISFLIEGYFGANISFTARLMGILKGKWFPNQSEALGGKESFIRRSYRFLFQNLLLYSMFSPLCQFETYTYVSEVLMGVWHCRRLIRQSFECCTVLFVYWFKKIKLILRSYIKGNTINAKE